MNCVAPIVRGRSATDSGLLQASQDVIRADHEARGLDTTTSADKPAAPCSRQQNAAMDSGNEDMTLPKHMDQDLSNSGGQLGLPEQDNAACMITQRESGLGTQESTFSFTDLQRKNDLQMMKCYSSSVSPSQGNTQVRLSDTCDTYDVDGGVGSVHDSATEDDSEPLLSDNEISKVLPSTCKVPAITGSMNGGTLQLPPGMSPRTNPCIHVNSTKAESMQTVKRKALDSDISHGTGNSKLSGRGGQANRKMSRRTPEQVEMEEFAEWQSAFHNNSKNYRTPRV
ncbi:hypothetical protein K461DRAFT_266998 [Myriangium duriaei CBS 260.36]|uniref:Uncharacterized protein n=1 Tax=Myriangium duriaei CBS 260.36 TaxID=1168546 RepID=A0A9P4MGQ8_9PEZI|nr:hypothetical protein K461DRAFT_266998 [Myriangium duriaei CBS 260.36]